MASTLLADIDFLTSREEFQRFLEVLQSMEATLAKEVLEGDMSDKEREARRNFRLGIVEAIRATDEIRRRNTELLYQHRAARHLISPHLQETPATGRTRPRGKVQLAH